MADSELLFWAGIYMAKLPTDQNPKYRSSSVNAMCELIDEICKGSANFFSFWEPLTQVWLGNKAQQCKQKSHLFMKHVLCAKKLSFQIGTSILNIKVISQRRKFS